MPRIDPIQLLKCLTVLLSPSGGIRSKDEVARLASLMNKFSKKLVSKCIYIQILKATETNLLGLFMGAGGWDLAYTWLTDSIEAANWPLAQELLELLLLCPVDVDRLKTNTCPKRVKELSKDNTRPVIRTLAGKLVEQWLKIVKGEYCEPLLMTNIIQLVNECTHDVTNNVKPCMHVQDIKIEETKDNLDLKMEAMYDTQANVNPEDISIPNTVVEDIKMPIDIVSVSESKERVQLSVEKNDEENSDTETLPILKISMKNGKQIISKVEDTTEKKRTDLEKNESSTMLKDKVPKLSSSGKHKDKGRSRITSKSSSSRSSGQSSKSSSDELSSKSSLDGYSSKSSSEGHSSKSSSDKQKSGSSSSKNRDKSREDKSRSSSSRSSSSHRIKESERHKDRKSSDKSKSSSSSSRDKHESSKSGSSKSKSEKSNRDKDVGAMQDQKEKNKETLEKSQPPSIHKLGKIPKKSDLLGKKDGPSFSIEVRKADDPKPKTIKMFNSKFRSHGLEEEAKPPPSRNAIQKKPLHSMAMPAAVPKLISPIASALHKRTSPNRISLDTPPEKKLKLLEHTDKPGAIKLIPPKPKPVLLLESDMFMDALTASASTNKKEPKKRKRRASESKDGNPTPTEVTAPATNDASSPLSSPLTSPVRSEPKSAPLRFYQDTLETEEDKVKEIEDVTDEIRRSPEQKEETPTSPVPKDKPTEKLVEKLTDPTSEKSTDKLKSDISDSNTVSSSPGSDSKEDNRLPGGILTYHKKKGPKKSLRWRTADELEEIQYFELDENERINVTKTFIDMKNLERVHERESFQKSRNFHDIMEEKMNYRPLIPISIDAAPIEYGKNSREKDVQTAREKTVLQSLYFHKTQIPDSAAEPDVEVHSTTDPIIIPLDDVTGSLESTNDFRNTLWPEPKGLPPSNDLPPAPMFPPFGGGFPNQQFGMPGFQGMGPGNMPPGMSGPMGAMPPVGMPPGGVPPGVIPLGAMPPGVMPPGAMPPGVMPPGAMPPGSMPPGAMPPGPMPPGMIPDLMVQGGMTDMFGNQMFPNCPMPNGDAYNMSDNMNGPPMFQQGFPINGPQGPNNSNGPTGNNFFFNGGNRGGPRGGPRGSGPWRGKNSSGRWDGPASRGRGGGPRINKVCIHFSKKGSCKSGDKCPYKHPGVNCPY